MGLKWNKIINFFVAIGLAIAVTGVLGLNESGAVTALGTIILAFIYYDIEPNAKK